MGCTAEDPMAGGKENEIEIKIKTLDSQIYTMRVNKQVPVSDLKQQISTVTGVLADQQRLICRGKVLKDDQRLYAYHVEDGHTLHLVTRQPIPRHLRLHRIKQADTVPGSGMSHQHDNQVAAGLHENSNVCNQSDAIPPVINQLAAAAVGAFGANDVGGNQGPNVRVAPDSLITLSQYLSRLRRAFGGGNVHNVQATSMLGTEERVSNPLIHSVSAPVLPTASLAGVIQSARQMLIEQLGESLLQLQRQLENQEHESDLSERRSIQPSAGRAGVLLQNVGSFLLELGCTIMTLRMGQMPSDAVVDTGPAVFISPSGPNPLMVQTRLFHLTTNLGQLSMGTAWPGSSLVDGFGTFPRHPDIQIRIVSATVDLNANHEEHDHTHQRSEQRNPVISSAGENPATFVVPEGLPMLGAVSGSFSNIPSDLFSSLLRLYPVLERLQYMDTGRASDQLGSRTSGQHQARGCQSEQFSGGCCTTEASLRTPSLNLALSESLNFRFNLQSTSETLSQQEAENNVLQFLRTIFPSGEFEHLGDFTSHGMATSPVTDHSEAATGHSEAATDVMDAQKTESEVTDEGIFLSNMLQEMMPFISLNVDPSAAPPEESSVSESRTDPSSVAESSVAGTSHRESANLGIQNARRWMNHPEAGF